MKSALLLAGMLLATLAQAEPRVPEDQLRGRSQQYQQGYRQGFQDAVRMMNGQGSSHHGSNSREIRIESAWYGSEGRSCDFTQSLARKADGKSSYYLTANNRLCGDPADGFVKKAHVRYRCGYNLKSAILPEGRGQRLSCY